MIRKFLIIAFVLSVASNSLAGVLPYILGEGECEAKCCRIVGDGESRANQSRLRCLMECGRAADSQGVPGSQLLRIERVSKVVAPVSPGIQALCSPSNVRSLRSPVSVSYVTAQIYLKTGALLI